VARYSRVLGQQRATLDLHGRILVWNRFFGASAALAVIGVTVLIMVGAAIFGIPVVKSLSTRVPSQQISKYRTHRTP
jgi:hypothetical protein